MRTERSSRVQPIARTAGQNFVVLNPQQMAKATRDEHAGIDDSARVQHQQVVQGFHSGS